MQVIKESDIPDIIYEKRGPVVWATLNRPSRLNALVNGPGGLCEQIGKLCDEVRYDDEVRVVVFKGAGRCFCAGYDISPDSPRYEIKGLAVGRETEPWFTNRFHPETGEKLSWEMPVWQNPKVFIAMVHSYCLGAGLQLANACDLVFASPDALFAYPPVRWGGSLVMAILPPWLLGLRMSKEMSFTGKMINTETALRVGLINRIISRDMLEEEVDREARHIATIPALSATYSKMAINNYYEGLGMEQAKRYGNCLVRAIEFSNTIPGGLLDFREKAKEWGLKKTLEWRDSKYAEFDRLAREQMVRPYEKKG
jgi:enoyl-CoA hydratase